MEKLRNIFSFFSNKSSGGSSVSLNSYKDLTNDCYEFSPFIKLPVEIQAKIFQELPVQDIKQARLVCSTWRKIIDATSLFSVIIDEKIFDYSNDSFPNWRVVQCFVRHFREQTLDTINFLRFPDDLKKLTIWGSVLPTNFHRILNAARNLEELDLANKALVSGGPAPLWEIDGVLQRINFNNLRKLSVFSADSMRSVHENLNGLFMQSMPNLTKFKLNIDDRYNGNTSYPPGFAQKELRVATALVLFIASHKNLKTIQITINPYIRVSEQHATKYLNQLNDSSKLEDNLEQLKLQNLRLNVAPLYMRLLRRIVINQSKLKDIRLQIPFWNTLPLQYSMLENSIESSIHTLVSIQIQWLSGFPALPVVAINFELFSRATSLRRLVLKRWLHDSIDSNGVATIINLPQLPSTIQDFGIEGFHCLTHELIELAEATGSVPKLNYVRLCHVGYQPGYGVDGRVTKTFCDRKSLHLLIMGPLKNRVHGSEDIEYQELRRRFDYDFFRHGQVINFDFARYKRRLQMKEEEEKRKVDSGGGMLSCFS